mgnify:CR=1 FL=1
MKIKHYALIPAKKDSSRFKNKNWRRFCKSGSLVDYTVKSVPRNMFEKIIVSTDKIDYHPPRHVLKHSRKRKLSRKDSCVKDLIRIIINEYGLRDEDYLWLLNPTSPFREITDFAEIVDYIARQKPDSVISVVEIHPFIWKGSHPLFETRGKRRNTESFKEKYFIENGMFYVMNIGYFRSKKSWYGRRSMLYKRHDIFSFVDIDTEEEFVDARKLAGIKGFTNRGKI